MITVERTAGTTTVTFPNDEVSEQQLNTFLDLVRHAQADSRRITKVDPLPPVVWERLYSRPDEFTGVTAEQLTAAQVQEEPQ